MEARFHPSLHGRDEQRAPLKTLAWEATIRQEERFDHHKDIHMTFRHYNISSFLE